MTQPDPSQLDYQAIIKHIIPGKDGWYSFEKLLAYSSEIELCPDIFRNVTQVLRDLGYTGYWD